jgi:hypothetical protein
MLQPDILGMFFAFGNLSLSDTGAFFNVNARPALLAMDAGAARFNACVAACNTPTCLRYSNYNGRCVEEGLNPRCKTMLPGSTTSGLMPQGIRSFSDYYGDYGGPAVPSGPCAHHGSVTCVPAVCFNHLPVMRVGCAQTPTAANLTSPEYASGVCNTNGGPNLSPPPQLGDTTFGGYAWNGTHLAADAAELRRSWTSGPARHIEHAYAIATNYAVGTAFSPYELVTMLYLTDMSAAYSRHPNTTAVLATLKHIPAPRFLSVL